MVLLNVTVLFYSGARGYSSSREGELGLSSWGSCTLGVQRSRGKEGKDGGRGAPASESGPLPVRLSSPQHSCAFTFREQEVRTHISLASVEGEVEPITAKGGGGRRGSGRERDAVEVGFPPQRLFGEGRWHVELARA